MTLYHCNYVILFKQKKFNIDINNWMVNSVEKSVIDSIEKEIFKMIK